MLLATCLSVILPGSERTKYIPILMLVIKRKTCTWFVIYLFVCLLFLPFSLMQSSTARDKDEQALPVGSSGPVCTCTCACGERGAGVGGWGAHVLNKSSSPLEYLNGLICRCPRILWPIISDTWILTISDKLSLRLGFTSLSSLFHSAWTFIGVERLRYSQIAFQGMLSWHLGIVGDLMLDICFLRVSACT